MRDFFKGWRRKVGLVALAMAVLTSITWLRSQFVTEIWTFTLVDRKHQVYLENHQVCWVAARRGPDDNFPDGWNRLDRPSSRATRIEQRLYDLTLILSVIPHGLRADTIELREWRIPVQWVVLPLTLLSAWLILRKPRTKPDNRLSSPLPNPQSLTPDHA